MAFRIISWIQDSLPLADRA